MDKTTKTIVGIIVALIVIGGIYAIARNNQNGGTGSTGNNSGNTVESSGPIKIGFVGPLSGDTANLGENLRAALQIKQREINDSGGINGRDVEMIYEDGMCEAKAATNAGNKLINSDKVVAIIGGLCSAETLALAPMAEQARIPLISSSSTSPKITEAGDYIFRFVVSDSFQGKFAAEHLAQHVNKKRVAVLYCLSDYCVGIHDVFKQELPKAGGQLVADEGYQRGVTDLRSQLVKIKAANPDVVYFLGYTEEAILGLKQMKELGLNVPVFSADSWDDPKIVQDTKGVIGDVTYAIPGNQTLPQSFIDKMNKETNGKELIVYAPRAYDILTALSEIIGRVGTDGEKIKNELYKLNGYKGLADTYTMDKNGDVTSGQFAIKKFQDGKAVEVK